MTRDQTKTVGIIGGVFYALAALVCFGHAAAAAERSDAAADTVCQAVKATNPQYLCVTVGPPPAVRGIVAGILWPLYASWEAFS